MGIISLSKFCDIVYWCTGLALSFFYSFLYFRVPRRVPSSTDPLLYISAIELARRIRNNELRSVDVVNSYYCQQNQVNRIINAITESRENLALRDAQKVDEIIHELHQKLNSGSESDADAARAELKRIEVEQPLFGVPVSVKHFFTIQNFLETAGIRVRMRKDKRSSRNAQLVDCLQRAGAVILCHTNACELGMWSETSGCFGRTYNPYDTRRTCGGSSGGEGALVGSAGSVLGLGSDVGGSIRIPAALCGVFGHKPTTPGLVPAEPDCGHFPHPGTEWATRMLGFGPLCRYSEDLWPFLQTIMSDAGRQKLYFKSPQDIDLKKVKFYILPSLVATGAQGENLEDTYCVSVEPEVRAGIDRVAAYLRDKVGASVELFPAAPLDGTSMFGPCVHLQRIFFRWFCKICATTERDAELARRALHLPEGHRFPVPRGWDARLPSHREMLLDIIDDVTIDERRRAKLVHGFSPIGKILKQLLFYPFIRTPYEIATLGYVANRELFHRFHTERQILEGVVECEMMRGEFERFFEHEDPSIGEERYMKVIICPAHPRRAPLHHQKLLTPHNVLYTMIWNAVGLPATVVPIGLDTTLGRGYNASGLPLTVQVVAGPFCDALNIAVAKELESAFGGWSRPSK